MIRIIFLILTLSFITGCATINIMDNPRIPEGNYSDAQEKIILEGVNSLEHKACIDSYISTYQGNLLKYCQQTDGGNYIGGGCHHVAYAWSINIGVLDEALTECKTPNKPLKQDK